MPIASGQREHYVTLHAPARTRGDGLAVDLATHVPARISAVPLAFQMQERIASGGLMRQTLYAVVLGYRVDVKADLVLREECHGRLELQILIIRPSDKHDELELTCVAGEYPLVEESPISSYAESVLADASHYWRLNDTSGLTVVDMIGGAHGTVSGNVTLNQPGALSDDAAMTFALGHVAGFSVTLPLVTTIEAWVKTTRAAYGAILSTRHQPPIAGDLQLGLDAAGRLTVFGATSTLGGVVVIADSAWHYVVAVIDGATSIGALYLDGVLLNTTTAFTHAAMLAPAPSAIGSDPYTAAFDGSIDEVAIYPFALTAQQVAARFALRS